MKGGIFISSQDAELNAEVEREPSEPMSDERFREICLTLRLMVSAVAAVAVVWLSGIPGLILDGVVAFAYGLYKLCRDDAP